jgi:predicted AAA+ superfamily ATPase
MPYFANVGKRLMKHPKIYFRDTGVLHYLLGIDSLDLLRTSPYRGFSFEGLVIENIIQNLDAMPNARNEYYFYRTAQGDEIDLLVKTGSKLTAFEIKTSSSVSIRDLSGFQRCMQHLKIEKGIVIYMGKDDFSLTSNIEVRSARKYLMKPICERTLKV